MNNIISDYLREHINEPMNDVLQGLEQTLQDYVSDRRYKLTRVHMASNGSGTSWSGMVSFRGVRYYVDVIQPWAMCPNGKTEAKRMD